MSLGINKCKCKCKCAYDEMLCCNIHQLKFKNEGSPSIMYITGLLRVEGKGIAYNQVYQLQEKIKNIRRLYIETNLSSTNLLTISLFLKNEFKFKSNKNNISTDEMVDKFLDTSIKIGKSIKSFPLLDCLNDDSFLDQFITFHKICNYFVSNNYKLAEYYSDFASGITDLSLNNNYWTAILRHIQRNSHIVLRYETRGKSDLSNSNYDKLKFIHIRTLFTKPSLGFNWILRIRCRCKYNITIAFRMGKVTEKLFQILSNTIPVASSTSNRYGKRRTSITCLPSTSYPNSNDHSSPNESMEIESSDNTSLGSRESFI
ncbi:hypothetical protein H8356DRAFT_1339887 [Neocallimastix lanati (nom. inval.)]|nr:hypothetical protein H8356DRAFT_1339887 [Neocallimastix sp. JGI-2020a]